MKRRQERRAAKQVKPQRGLETRWQPGCLPGSREQAQRARRRGTACCSGCIELDRGCRIVASRSRKSGARTHERMNHSRMCVPVPRDSVGPRDYAHLTRRIAPCAALCTRGKAAGSRSTFRRTHTARKRASKQPVHRGQRKREGGAEMGAGKRAVREARYRSKTWVVVASRQIGASKAGGGPAVKDFVLKARASPGADAQP